MGIHVQPSAPAFSQTAPPAWPFPLGYAQNWEVQAPGSAFPRGGCRRGVCIGAPRPAEGATGLLKCIWDLERIWEIPRVPEDPSSAPSPHLAGQHHRFLGGGGGNTYLDRLGWVQDNPLWQWRVWGCKLWWETWRTLGQLVTHFPASPGGKNSDSHQGGIRNALGALVSRTCLPGCSGLLTLGGHPDVFVHSQSTPVHISTSGHAPRRGTWSHFRD